MIINDITTLDSSYETIEEAANSGWLITNVNWPELGAYHEALRDFESTIRLHALEEEWIPFLSYCKRYRFFLSSTPIPPAKLTREMKHWKINGTVPLEVLRRSLAESLDRSYLKLIASFDALQQQSSNPLWDAAKQNLLETWESDAELAVLCTESRLNSLVQNFLTSELENFLACWVMKPSELKCCYTYDHFLAFGPTRRLFFDGSMFVYTAPRAKVLTLFTPHVFSTSIPTPYQFAGSPHLKSLNGSSPTFSTFAPPVVRVMRDERLMDPLTVAQVDQEWLASLPPFILPPKSFVDNAVVDGFSDEVVSAKQVLLTADHAVFLLADGGIYRVGRNKDPETGSSVCSGVEYTEVEDLGPGDIILFQEQGGGSMVAEVANELMGERSVEFRKVQLTWKISLLEQVRSVGIYEIARKLRDMGASLDASVTVRNWCSPENIGPGNWKNFALLLEILGLEDSKSEIFEATRSIRSAHQSAGFKLAGRLMTMMEGRRLDDFDLHGWQEFGGVAGMPNRKIAYEIVAVLPHTIDVHPSQLQHPFELL